jgi:hypothetical protein
MLGMSLKWASQPYAWGLLSMGLLLSTPMIAQANPTDSAPIKQPSAFEAVDHVSGTNSFWSELSISDDTKDLFLIERNEARIERRAKNLEMVYHDLLKQQTEDHAIVRTQDIPNLFETSLLEMQK